MSAILEIAATERNGKNKRYAWTPLSNKGRLEWIDKNALSIDHTYQRRAISKDRIAEIAANFSWMFFGVLSVAKRPDGTYWCYDGQHRLKGSRKRDDIQSVPCWVFDVVELREEAKAFVGANTVRGAMASTEKFRGALVAEDPVSLKVASILERLGYSVGSSKQGQINCIAAVVRSCQRDTDSTERVLKLCAELYGGESIKDNVFRGLSYLDWHLKNKLGTTIDRRDIREKIKLIGPEGLLRAIQAYVALGKGGERNIAAGIVVAINKGKTTNRIPALVA